MIQGIGKTAVPAVPFTQRRSETSQGSGFLKTKNVSKKIPGSESAGILKK
jgi:hypothetical protein